MKLLICIGGLLGLSLLVWWWLSNPQTQLNPKNDTIVFFGDSLVEGVGAASGNDLPAQLSRLLGKPIINLGVSGNTTADGVARLSSVLARDPGLVFVLLGGNDALRKVPQTETEANLRVIIASLQAKGSAVVLVGIRSGLLGDRYDEMFERLADEYELLLIPDALSGLIGRPRYMADAIHPNDAGYAILAERIFAAIAPQLMLD